MSALSTSLNKQDYSFTELPKHPTLSWCGSLDSVAWEQADIKEKLSNLEYPCYVVEHHNRLGVTNEGCLTETIPGNSDSCTALAAVPPLSIGQLGDPGFLSLYGVSCAYMTGAMANGIASEDMVIALGKNKILGSFGSAGLLPARVQEAIYKIQQALPQGPYAFNLIHSPNEPEIERQSVELYINQQIKTVEASAFLDITPNIVRYRASGLQLNSLGQIQINHRIIAKVSRTEVATKFMRPAPRDVLRELVNQEFITESQAVLAEKVPLADDITAEADSGGHTDNRPLTCLFSTLLRVRDDLQSQYGYESPIRVGAGGGIGTPQAVLAALMMGAAYVVTGSVNQSCKEAGTSAYVKTLLSQADMTDVAMAPAADMFEMGVKLQVLKRGTLFPMRAQKLFDCYKQYESIETIPASEREHLEKKIFRSDLDQVWQETVTYFSKRDPDQITRALHSPKRKMALIFRWYLGLASRWALLGEVGREADYQIWCGPTMGAFNTWVKGTYLADPENRGVVDVARHLMRGAAVSYRLQNLQLQGVQLPRGSWQYTPPLIME